jgi:hypothetical protein
LAAVEPAGVTWIVASTAAVTESPVEPETLPKVAAMVVEPTPAPVARPWEPTALEMVATEVDDEVQVTWVVRSWMVLSLYTPVAVYCFVVPLAIDEPTGVTWMEESVAAVTVSPVDPETPPKVAVMVVDPTPAPVARPCKPAALEIVATEVADEVQVTWLVRSWKVPSLKMPVAANWIVVPLAIEEPAGVTWIVDSTAAVTARSVDPEMLPLVAVMVVEPWLSAVPNPWEPAVLEMVATEVADEVQVTWVVRSWVELSL